jgi:hypothetical protein
VKISNDKHRQTGRAALTWVVALTFFSQMMAIGFATGAMANEFSNGVFGAICVSDKSVQGAADSKAPCASHVGLCCVLHSSSAIENEFAREPAKYLATETPPILPSPIFRVDAVHSAPELRPLCSRAPPARAV